MENPIKMDDLGVPLFILASKAFPSQLSPSQHLRHHPHGRRFVREGAQIM